MNKPPGFYFPATEINPHNVAYIRWKYKHRNSPTYQVNQAAAERLALCQGLGRMARRYSNLTVEEYISNILSHKLDQLAKFQFPEGVQFLSATPYSESYGISLYPNE